jgi:hypothetical protein
LDGSHIALFMADPQGWNSYAYGRNNPLRFNDPDGQLFKQAWQAIQGFSNAVVTNNTFGVGRASRDDSYYQQGQRVGDVVSFVQGAVETGIGMAVAAAGAAGGIVTSPTGVGAVAGAGVAAGGLAAAGHGASVSLTAGNNLGKGRDIPTVKDRMWTNRDSYRDSTKSANGHWSKHKNEFPELKNAKEYVSQAHEFANKPPKGTLYRNLENGRDAFYNPRTNTLVLTKDGTPSNMFRPKNGINYFNNLK